MGVDPLALYRVDELEGRRMANPLHTAARASRADVRQPAAVGRPTLRRTGPQLAKGRPGLSEAPAPAKSGGVNGNLVFALAAFLFGVALLLGWRFGPADGNPNSFMLVAASLSTFFGGWMLANELGILAIFSEDLDAQGFGDSDAD